MNGRVAKVLRKIGRAESKKHQAPERELIRTHVGIINHPATARGIYRKMKQAYYKGL